MLSSFDDLLLQSHFNIFGIFLSFTPFTSIFFLNKFQNLFFYKFSKLHHFCVFALCFIFVFFLFLMLFLVTPSFFSTEPETLT